MKLISAKTREAAWLSAVDHLLHQNEETEYNLIVEVEEPDSSNNHSKYIRHAVDDLFSDAIKLFNKKKQSEKKNQGQPIYPINTVAETIFPAHLYKKLKSLEKVQNEYLYSTVDKIKPYNGNRKGTYAERIFYGKNYKGEEVYPLVSLVNRLKNQLKNKNGNRCAYELSLDAMEDETCLTIPVNRNDSSLRGFPCLSHLSFKVDLAKEKLLLTAIYRSQSMVYKGLGNFLGLARLQDAVAREAGLETGSFICHATYATLERPPGLYKSKLRDLVESAKEYES